LIDIGPMRAGDAAAGPSLARRGARLTERNVLAAGTAVTGLFVLAAIVVGVRSAATGGPTWAALHLALAGGATVAIGTFMPHFAVTVSGSRPAPAAGRLGAILLLAAGATAVVLGLTTLGAAWTAVGASMAIAGVGATAVLTVLPSRNPLARRHPIATVAYLVALIELAVAMGIGAAATVGVPEVAQAWASLRPAHAWLSLFGAVSLTIFATLVYLAPTILGARIRPTLALAIGLGGILLGPPLAAAGFAADGRFLVGIGMACTLAGALGQLAYLIDVLRRSAAFASEHDWRRASALPLLAGSAWFAVAVAAALVELVAGGRLAGWSVGHLAMPMVAGWMLQELVGSWTYLVPSVTPGEPRHHAAQRRALAPLSRLRPIAWNVGLGVAFLGGVADASAAVTLGVALTAGSVLASLAFLGRALTLARY
jgi:hypothetical protein